MVAFGRACVSLRKNIKGSILDFIRWRKDILKMGDNFKTKSKFSEDNKKKVQFTKESTVNRALFRLSEIKL
jgi:hypothetical protein